MVYIAKTARGEWDWFDFQTISQSGMRFGEYPALATYGSQLTQTLPRGAAKRIENTKNLCWVEWGAGKSDVVTYLIQVVDEPCKITVFQILQTFSVFVPVKYVLEPIGKVGRGTVKATYSFQGRMANWGHGNIS